MKYSFAAFGHENIIGKHRTTLEFTKDSNISKKGDCIIGVKCDFDLKEINKIIKASKNSKIKISILWQDKSDEVVCFLNSGFKSNHELVVRKTDFVSDRTLGIKANKSSFELNRDLISYLKNNKAKISVILENSD